MAKYPTRGAPAKDWVTVFRKADVLTDSLSGKKSDRSQSTVVGQFLSRFPGQVVPIEVDGRTGRATLRVAGGRAREKRYHFEVVWDDTGPPDNAAGSQPTLAPATETVTRADGTEAGRPPAARTQTTNPVPAAAGNGEEW